MATIDGSVFHCWLWIPLSAYLVLLKGGNTILPLKYKLLYKKMKVGDQAVFFAMLKGLSRKEAPSRLKEWFEKFGILDF